jgi:hypothetical protein
MSAPYRHLIGPWPSRKPSSNSCKKETSGLDIYSLARRLLANGTIHPETRHLHTFASGRPKPGFKVQWHLRQI